MCTIFWIAPPQFATELFICAVIESAAESSLSGDDTMAFTKVAYRSHLIIANPFSSSSLVISLGSIS